MSSPQSMRNISLPFDILGVVFSHYADRETIHHPLETLLLVSRSWTQAALGHRILWRDFKIYLGHNPTSQIWRTRLPLRLARAGAAVPLCISLFNVLNMEDRHATPDCCRDDIFYSDYLCQNTAYVEKCACYEVARSCAKFALRCFTGEKGELCARWKTFHVDLGYLDNDESMSVALCYPTPSLTSLRLSSIIFRENEQQKRPILSETPALEELILVDCLLPALPNLHDILELNIDGKKMIHLGGCSDFRQAKRLQVLRLRDVPVVRPLPGDFAPRLLLPERLPDLHTVELIGYKLPACLYTCEAVNVSNIALTFRCHSFVTDVLRCTGINMKKVNKLTIVWAPPVSELDDFDSDDFGAAVWTVEACEELLGSLARLLTRTSNLRYLVGDPSALSACLKILWDSWHDRGGAGILAASEITLLLIKDTIIGGADANAYKTVIRGDNSPGSLVQTARQWRLLAPELPIAEFLNILSANHARLNS